MPDGNGRISDPAGSGSVLALALAFFCAGCVLLAVTGPTLGALHAFAAFIVLAIVAALNQLLPVLVSAPVARPAAVIAGGTAFAAGFALLVAGFYGYPTFAAAGAILAIAAVVWIAWNLLRLLAGARERQTRLAIGLALAGFAGAAGIGASMAAALAGDGPAQVLSLAPVHALLAILAFAAMLVVAISYRFVPMFAVAKGNAYGRRAAQWIFACACAASVAGAAVHDAAALRAGLAAVFAAGAWIVISHVRTLAVRLRKRLDVSIRYAAAGWAFALTACALALAATWDARFATAAVIAAVLGWLCITTLGYAYKVAGFLAWQSARQRYPAQTVALPPLSGAVDLRLAIPALLLMSAGALGAAAAAVAAPSWEPYALDAYAAGGLACVAACARLASTYLFGRFEPLERVHAAG